MTAEERAAYCVVTTLSGQDIPWALQHELIQRITEQIDLALSAERETCAADLALVEEYEAAARHLRELTRFLESPNGDVGEETAAITAA